MAILEMKKIRIFIHFKERFKVFEVLQRIGVFEFADTSSKEELWSGYIRKEQLAYESAQLDQIILFLRKYEQKKGILKTLREGVKQEITLKDAQESFLYSIKKGLDIKAKEVEDKIIESEARIRELVEECQFLYPWKDLSIDFSQLAKLTETKTIFFTIENKEKEKFLDVLDNLSDISYEVLENNFAFTYHREDGKKVENMLSKHAVKQVVFKNNTSTITVRISEIQEKIQKQKDRLSQFEKKAQELAKNLPHLCSAAQYIHWEEEKQNEISKGDSTKEILLYEGWVPQKRVALLQEEVSKVTDLYVIEEVSQTEKDNIPVEIENRGIFKPFEAVTRLYGLPAHNDIDPTAFLAGFFFIFFGFALSDVGYGVTLALISFLAIYFIKLPKNTKRLLSLLGIGGLSSIMIGVIFGGYLGIPLEYLPDWLVSLKKVDPISSPISILLIALFLGIIQIVVGLTLDIYRSYKNNNFIGGLLDRGPWIYLFFAIFITLLHSFNYLPDLLFPHVYFVYLGIIALVATQGRKEKSILGKLFKGIFSLYESVGFFSDILSYSRLLALGLATTAISFAVGTIAIIVRDLVPVFGFTLMILILVVGHIFNLAVNTLGAFIHGARLQFVEFFTKFITGTGRAFKPFSKEERFIILKD